MISPVISEIGVYNTPNAIRPIWNDGSETFKASESNALPTNKDSNHSVNPVVSIEEKRFMMM